MEVKFILIDRSDGYHTYVGKYDSKEKMLSDAQHRQVSEIEVYEVARKVKLTTTPAVVEEDA
jgi:hypothetical protein